MKSFFFLKLAERVGRREGEREQLEGFDMFNTKDHFIIFLSQEENDYH